MPELLYGKPVADAIEFDVRERVQGYFMRNGRPPHLTIIQAGDDAASSVYVGRKKAACDRVGIECRIVRPLELHGVEEALANAQDAAYTHGILLQLPLPPHMRGETKRLFGLIDPLRDVDVFHPENVGMLVQGRHRFFPCTPHAVSAILRHYKVPVAGSHVVVINRSDVVGKPLSSMLIQDNDEYANATVTVCHDRTVTWRLKQIATSADILVVAVGIPDFVKADLVRIGQTLIDVGINRLEGGGIVGDASPEAVGRVARYTPVPGGVGPVTVAMVLLNTITAAEALEK